jgi:hypothetical protein
MGVSVRFSLCLLASTLAGLTVCMGAGAATPPCTTSNCNVVTVSIPQPPPAPPKVWAGITRAQAVSEFKTAMHVPPLLFKLIRAVHAQCTIRVGGTQAHGRAWKLTVHGKGVGLYIVDSHGTFYGIEDPGGGRYPGCLP